MKPGAWDHPKDAGRLSGRDMEAVLDELCERKHSFILATPYLSFDSRFLGRHGEGLKVRATMGRDTVKHALSPHPLRFRFPWALSFYSGCTKVLDYVQEESHRYLVLSVPESLVPDENRQAMRIDRVGRSQGTMGSQDLSLVRVSLENLCTLGAGIFALEPLSGDSFQPGRSISLSLNLERGPELKAKGRICHSEGQSMGICFQPPLESPMLDELIEWLKPKHEDLRRTWENRVAMWAQAEQAAQPKAPPGGILLLTRDAELMGQMASALEDISELRISAPVMGPFKKEVSTQPPLMLLIHPGEGMEVRHRLRSMAESLPLHCPVVVLGQGPESGLNRQFATDLKAAAYLEWNPGQTAFFRRLVQGLLRIHWGLGGKGNDKT